MGGLDLCFGRWDSNSHPIADAHPTDVKEGVFPGQDYNNARIYDFADVSKFDMNKLDRTKSSRMGWTDISICLRGPIVQDIKAHFVQRWNYIYEEKYRAQDDSRYTPLVLEDTANGYYQQDGKNAASLEGPAISQQEPTYEHSHHNPLRHFYRGDEQSDYEGRDGGNGGSSVSIQLVRSCTKWSNGVATEHSIADAYIQVIRDSQYFVYIENQFFITATGEQQKPIKNQVGAAIVERIIRAARNGEKYKMMVMMPSVPAFAGDLQSDDALGTRAIMEFQYDSINRGGHSIYEEISKAGFNPMEYIRFYNLRSYDRINASGVMRSAEQDSGVSYQQASEGYDAAHDGRRRDGEFEGSRGIGEYEGTRGDYQAYRPPPTAQYGVYEMDSTPAGQGGYGQQQYGQQSQDTGHGARPDEDKKDDYNRYQEAAAKIGGRQGLGDGRWDSVAEVRIPVQKMIQSTN